MTDDLSDDELLEQVFDTQILIGNFFNENKITCDRALKALVVLFGNAVILGKIDEEDLRVFHKSIIEFSKIMKKSVFGS